MTVSSRSLANLDNPHKLTRSNEVEGRNSSIHEIDLIRSEGRGPFHFKTFKIHFQVPYAKSKTMDLTFEVDAMSVEAALESVALFSKAASFLTQEEFEEKLQSRTFDVVLHHEGGEVTGDISSLKDGVALHEVDVRNLRILSSNLAEFDGFSCTSTLIYDVRQSIKGLEQARRKALGIAAKKTDLEAETDSDRVGKKKKAKKLKNIHELEELSSKNEGMEEELQSYLRFIEQNAALKARLREFENRFAQIEKAMPDSEALKDLQADWQVFADSEKWSIDGREVTLTQIQQKLDAAMSKASEIQAKVGDFDVFEPGHLDKLAISANNAAKSVGKFPGWVASKFKKS